MPATVAYTYLGLNTPVRADYEDPDVRWDLITGSSPNPYAGLDRFGRTIDCRWEKYSSTAADLARLKYGYNRASSRQWRDDTVGTGFDEFYTYDAVQRLIDMERGTLTGGPPPTGITSPTLAQEWDLDPTGNWSGFEQTLSGAVTQTRTSNMDNEITNITNSVGTSWLTPTYNNAGGMALMPSAGATPTPVRAATYDAWDRTTRIAGGVTGTGDYRYDGLNRRTTKATLSPNETRHFYYSDQWQVLEERVGSSTDAERQHVWGLRYVDDLALRDRDTNGDGSLDERLYSMQDDNWNVVAICNPSAVVQERYAYTPYGMIQFLNASFGAITASAFAWRYLFTGRERDTESTLQYNRNRYYHARLGVWTTRDPMGYAAGDTNLFRYVVNRPCDELDPSGKDPLLMFLEWLFRPEPPPVATGRYWICMKPVNVTGLGELEAFFAQTSSAQHTGIGVGNCDSIATIREGRGGTGACGPLNIPCPVTVATNNTLKSGIGAGVSCRCATDAQIQSCVVDHPKLPGAFNHYTNNCQTDVANTARACCLLIGSCYLPADILRQWLLLQAEPQYWMSS